MRLMSTNGTTAPQISQYCFHTNIIKTSVYITADTVLSEDTMPFAMLWRNPDLVTDTEATLIRDLVHVCLQQTLEVASESIDVRVRDTEPLDLDQSPIVIIIDIGLSTYNKKKEVAQEIADQVSRSAHLKSQHQSCVRMCGGVITPIVPAPQRASQTVG